MQPYESKKANEPFLTITPLTPTVELENDLAVAVEARVVDLVAIVRASWVKSMLVAMSLMLNISMKC